MIRYDKGRFTVWNKGDVVAGFKYEYTCPNCGSYLVLKMRVTITRRRCPECGTPITPHEIDIQRERQKLIEMLGKGCGCLVAIVMLVVPVLFCCGHLSRETARFRNEAEHEIKKMADEAAKSRDDPKKKAVEEPIRKPK
jgi:predicted RNA-binding Zn-ribbon protein involved in translation (DUF1610 family)